MAVRDEEVVVEVPEHSWPAAIARRIDRWVVQLARHWLFVFNLVVGLFIAFPFLAPVLMHVGATGVARVIYAAYSPTCHQLPERSYFLFGPSAVYSEGQLDELGVLPRGLSILQRQLLRFNGTEATGYKVAVCERDVAIYGAILLGGLVFARFRTWRGRAKGALPKLPLWAFALLIAPMAVDGLTQLVGLRESDWLFRTGTGALFGLALVALAYPYVEEAMRDIMASSGRSAEGHKNLGS